MQTYIVNEVDFRIAAAHISYMYIMYMYVKFKNYVLEGEQTRLLGYLFEIKVITQVDFV